MKGSQLLKVVSIIMLVFAAIALVISVMAIIGFGTYSSLGGYTVVNPSIMWIVFLIGLVNVGLGFYASIMGINNCEKPEKASFLMRLGIGIIALQLLGNIIGVIGGAEFKLFSTLFGLILPGLYIAGCVQLKSNIE